MSRFTCIQHGRRRGFTLVELLVTIVLVSIVMLAALSLASSMSNIFYTQDQTVDAQGNLRFGVDFLSRDLRRAGFLASPAVNRDGLVCPKPSEYRFRPATGEPDLNAPVGAGGLWGIRVIDGGAAGAVYTPAAGPNSNIQPDVLYLVGSFESSATFPVVNVQPGSPVAFDPIRLGERLGSGSPERRFTSLFRTGRLARVTDRAGVSQYARIASSNWAGGNATVQLEGLVQRTGGAGCGIEGITGQGYEISVVNVIRYRLRRDPNEPNKMDLVREELLADTDGIPPVPVLEYAADFQVWLDVDTQSFGAPAVTPDASAGDDQGNVRLSTIAAGPLWHEARVAHVQLSARTIREDRSFPHLPRANLSAPLLTYNIDEDPTSSSRVVTAGNSIELINIAFRNVN